MTISMIERAGNHLSYFEQRKLEEDWGPVKCESELDWYKGYLQAFKDVDPAHSLDYDRMYVTAINILASKEIILRPGQWTKCCLHTNAYVDDLDNISLYCTKCGDHHHFTIAKEDD